MSFPPRQRIQWLRFFTLIVLSVGAILQSSCTMGAQPKVVTWNNSTGAEGFQRLFWQAVKDKDWLQVESHMASNFVYLDAHASKDKPQTLEYVRGLNLKDFSLGDLTVTASGAEAVVTYTIALSAASGVSEDRSARRHMAVWQQEKSGWVLVALSDVGSKP
jgi:ketosteroid isomerase-like protein